MSPSEPPSSRGASTERASKSPPADSKGPKGGSWLAPRAQDMFVFMRMKVNKKRHAGWLCFLQGARFAAWRRGSPPPRSWAIGTVPVAYPCIRGACRDVPMRTSYGGRDLLPQLPFHRPMDVQYLTTAEAANRLGFTVQHTRRLVRDGIIEGRKLGRDWLLTESSVERHRVRGGTHRLSDGMAIEKTGSND